MLLFFVLTLNEAWNIYGRIISQVEPSRTIKTVLISADRHVPLSFTDRKVLHMELSQMYHYHDMLFANFIHSDSLYTIKCKENNSVIPPNVMFFKNSDNLIVIMRSTKSNYEMYQDMKITQTYIKNHGWVHSGITTIYRDIRAELLKYILKNHHKYQQVIVFGHSLGGALASILCYDIMKNHKKLFFKSKFFSSGTPKIFEPKIVDYMEAYEQSYRHILIVNNADPICNFPISSTKDQGYYWYYKAFVKHRIFFNKVFQKKAVDSHLSYSYSSVLWSKDSTSQSINYIETF